MNNYLLKPCRYWKSIILTVFILILCLVPSSELTKLNVNITFGDVVVHFIMFGVFSAVVYADIIRQQPTNRHLSPWFKALIMGVALGIITELLQLLLTSLNRSGSMIDLLFDVLGSLAGIGFLMLIKRKPDPGR